MTEGSGRLGYMPALDGLRAVAIVLVVACHVFPAFYFGMLGVDVFFVLSGFLITTLIADGVRTGEFSRRRFYARRAIRLVPALVVTVVVFAPIGAVVFGPLVWLGAVGALLYLSPLVPLTMFSHTWTLAVEEWFYLLWPVVLGKFFRDRLTFRQVAVLVGALAVAMQAAMLRGPGSIAARPSALFAGCALALWWVGGGGRFKQPTMVLGAGMASVLAGAALGSQLYGPVPFWLAVSGAVAVIGALVSGALGPVRKWLELAPMVAVGVVSYEWYLLHNVMLKLSDEVWGARSYWVVVPLSLGLAFALHYALVPLQARLRARLEVRRDHDVAVATVAARTRVADAVG